MHIEISRLIPGNPFFNKYLSTEHNRLFKFNKTLIDMQIPINTIKTHFQFK